MHDVAQLRHADVSGSPADIDIGVSYCNCHVVLPLALVREMMSAATVDGGVCIRNYPSRPWID